MVLPFVKFPGVDALLGPEMKSTGEAMGQAETFGDAFAKASLGCGTALPLAGSALITVNDSDKAGIVPIARRLAALGFQLHGHPRHRRGAQRRRPGRRSVSGRATHRSPNVNEVITSGQVALIVNTPFAGNSLSDGAMMRRLAVRHGVPYCTTLTAASAAVEGIRALQQGPLEPWALQDCLAAPAADRTRLATNRSGGRMHGTHPGRLLHTYEHRLWRGRGRRSRPRIGRTGRPQSARGLRPRPGEGRTRPALCGALEQAGLGHAAFVDVEANPSVDTVEACLDAYRSQGCDGLLAVGGGSPMDTAKAAGVLATNPAGSVRTRASARWARPYRRLSPSLPP